VLALPPRLHALPGDVQAIIFRKAGRHSRLVCQLGRDAFGALDCGIQLDCIDTDDDVNQVLAGEPGRFEHVTALRFTAEGLPGVVARQPPPEDVFSRLLPAFPNLQSLEVAQSYMTEVVSSRLQALTSLRSCLTSLALPTVTARGMDNIMESLSQLTALRSLSFDCSFLGDALSALEPHLPHLVQLQCPCNEAGLNDYYAIEYCPALPPLKNLTDLGVHIHLSRWEDEAVAVLRTALTQLTALTLLLHFDHDEDDENHAVMAALAQRTALKSLMMDVDYISRQGHNLSSLSALQLDQLHVIASSAEISTLEVTSKLEVLLEAMAVRKTLTSLTVSKHCYDYADVLVEPSAELREEGLLSLAALAPRLRRLSLCATIRDAAGLFNVVGSMPLLTALQLDDDATVYTGGDAGGEEAARQLSTLTALEVLDLLLGARHLVRPALQALPSLTNLRALSVGCPTDQPADALDASVWHLTSLHRSLTHLGLGVRDLAGPTLGGILRHMTALQQLELSNMEVVKDRRLQEYLQPLPRSLRVLNIELSTLQPGVLAAMQALEGVRRGTLRVVQRARQQL
jgi:hypothetical protein